MLVVFCYLFHALWGMPFITMVTILLFQTFTFQRCYHGSLFTPSSYKRAYVSNTVTTEMSIIKFIPCQNIFFIIINRY